MKSFITLLLCTLSLSTLSLSTLAFSIQATPILKGESLGMKFELVEVANGLGIPWGMTQISDDAFIITERSGNLHKVNRHTGQIDAIKGLPEIHAKGQGGLLDIARSPRFEADQTLYFTYSKPVKDEGATTLAKAKYTRGSALSDWQDVLVTDSRTNKNQHFGSRITFDGKGHVFFGIGDRGKRDPAQDLSNHIGSVIRLKLDGTVPTDNPFVDKKGVKPEIWSYGHRNPQGIAYDLEHKRLWEIEHGPRGGDEINLILPGRNYGWPVISYGKEYWGPISVGEGTHKDGMEQPTKYYVPSIAPSSLIYYTGKAFPQWQGNLLSGALKLTHLNRVTLDKDSKATKEERLLAELNERIRALLQSREGWIYLTTDSGKLLALKPYGQ